MAAVITATTAQTFDVPSTVVTGSTNRRLKGLYLEGPKAATSDWFLLTTYLSTADTANIVSWHGITKITDVGDSYAIDVFTYDDDDYKLDCTSASTGTVSAFVYYYNE